MHVLLARYVEQWFQTPIIMMITVEIDLKFQKISGLTTKSEVNLIKRQNKDKNKKFSLETSRRNRKFSLETSRRKKGHLF